MGVCSCGARTRRSNKFCSSCKSKAKISENYDLSKRTWINACVDCGCAFKTNNPKTKRCTDCYYEFLVVVCSRCGEKFTGTRGQALRKDEMVQICPKCIEELDELYPGGKFNNQCDSCGEIVRLKTTTGTANCPNCGNPTDLEERICRGCGKNFKQYRNTFGYSFEYCEECREQKSESVTRYESLITAGWTDNSNLIMTNIPSESVGNSECGRCRRGYKKTWHRQLNCGYCMCAYTCEFCGRRFCNTDKRPQRFCSKSCGVAMRHKNKEMTYHPPKMNDEIKERLKAFDLDSCSDNEILELKETIDDSNSADYDFPGVWAKVTPGGEVVDLMATSNISREYRQVMWRMKYSQSRKYVIFREMNVGMRFIARCESYEDALIKELICAIRWHPSMWDPSPEQTNLIYNNEVAGILRGKD